MIDEKRVLQVAKEYGMNPDKARKLLEDARSEPAILAQYIDMNSLWEVTEMEEVKITRKLLDSYKKTEKGASSP